MTQKFMPFKNEIQSIEFQGLTLENGTSSINIYGNMNITRDKAGLDKAVQLNAILEMAIARMKDDLSHNELPDEVVKEVKFSDAPLVKNPFD